MRSSIKCLVAALAVASFGGLSTAAMAKHYSIVFDGYCDGMDFNTDKATGYAVGTHLNGDCGGTNFFVAGVLSKFGGAKQSILGDGVFAFYGFEAVFLINPNGTWQILGTVDGVSESVINSGTWSNGVPANSKSKKSTAAPAK